MVYFFAKFRLDLGVLAKLQENPAERRRGRFVASYNDRSAVFSVPHDSSYTDQATHCI